MKYKTDTMDIGFTFQMTLDSFLEERHPMKDKNQSSYDSALMELEKAQGFRSPLRKQAIAKEALRICPDCIEAYIVLGMHTQDIFEQMNVYKQGMELATMNLGKDFFQRDVVDFYEEEEAKPLLHIKFAYATLLYEVGYIRKAQKQFQEILNLNPSDVFSAQHYVLATYIYFEEIEQCKQRLHKFLKEDTFHSYVQFLQYIKEEDIVLASAYLCVLKKKNPYLYDMMTYQTMGSSILSQDRKPGSKEEAMYCYRILKKVTQSMEYLHIFMVKSEQVV